MGEARYCCEAKFANKAAAKQALPKINNFLERMAKTEKEWNRLYRSSKISSDSQLKTFVSKHRSVLKALELRDTDVIGEAKTKRLGIVCIRLNSPATDSFWSIFQQKDELPILLPVFS